MIRTQYWILMKTPMGNEYQGLGFQGWLKYCEEVGGSQGTDTILHK